MAATTGRFISPFPFAQTLRLLLLSILPNTSPDHQPLFLHTANQPTPPSCDGGPAPEHHIARQVQHVQWLSKAC